MFEEFMSMPMVRDITYITIKPADPNKAARFPKQLEEIPAIAYICVGIKAKTDNQNPNETETFMVAGGNQEEREMLKDLVNHLVDVAPDITHNKKGLYELDLPEPNSPVTSIRPDMSPRQQINNMKNIVKHMEKILPMVEKQEKKEGLITRFIKWLV